MIRSLWLRQHRSGATCRNCLDDNVLDVNRICWLPAPELNLERRTYVSNRVRHLQSLSIYCQLNLSIRVYRGMEMVVDPRLERIRRLPHIGISLIWVTRLINVNLAVQDVVAAPISIPQLNICRWPRVGVSWLPWRHKEEVQTTVISHHTV